MDTENITITVAPGRTVLHTETILPAEHRTLRDGKVETVTEAVTRERTFVAGQAFTLPADEAEYLIAAGFGLRPGDDPAYTSAPPRLVDQTVEAPAAQKKAR